LVYVTVYSPDWSGLKSSVGLMPVTAGQGFTPAGQATVQTSLLGTALALLTAGAAVFAVVIPISCHALPVAWPIRRIMYALALGVPLCLVGRLMGVGLGELSVSKAAVALVISGLVMVLFQYVMAKEWLREVRQAAGRNL